MLRLPGRDGLAVGLSVAALPVHGAAVLLVTPVTAVRPSVTPLPTVTEIKPQEKSNSLLSS